MNSVSLAESAGRKVQTAQSKGLERKLRAVTPGGLVVKVTRHRTCINMF